MSRLEAWDNVDEMERRDVASIVEDRNSTIKQYRTISGGDMDGFENQGIETKLGFLKNVQGRIDRRDRIYNPNRTEVSRSTEHLFIATLYSKDVSIDDALDLDGIRYTVTFVNRIGQSFTEAECVVST